MKGFFLNMLSTLVLTYLVITSHSIMTVYGYEQREGESNGMDSSSSTMAPANGTDPGISTTQTTTTSTTSAPSAPSASTSPSPNMTVSTGTSDKNKRPHFSGTLAFPPPQIEAVYRPAGNHSGTQISIKFVPLGKVIGNKFPGSPLYNFFNRSPNSRPGFFSHFRHNQTQGNHSG